jgi:protein FAM50
MADDGSGGPSFAHATSDINAALSTATVGLVSKAEFTRRREELEKAAAADAAAANADGLGAAETKAKKKKKKPNSTLSFGGDDDEEGAETAVLNKRPKLGKNPMVDSSFLPDREREEAAAAKKAELAAEWKQEQDRIRAEMIEVTYSFWDGKGHRHATTIPKGYTVSQFLNRCREQVKELRNASPADLMYVKEDLILPHSTTFYELIVNRARGKSGPLFNFDVHDDVRLGPLDARVEKDESHAGKVIEKRLYERNKDKFPYSRFEVYDPARSWETYTVHGSETCGEGVNTALL